MENKDEMVCSHTEKTAHHYQPLMKKNEPFDAV
jgi:hypothetical protein